jgi:hypothetical protein
MGMLFRYHNNIDIKANAKAEGKGAAEEVAPTPIEDKAEHGIPASAIKSMSGAKLRKLAAENGIEDPEELTVGELKAILIEKFS